MSKKITLVLTTVSNWIKNNKVRASILVGVLVLALPKIGEAQLPSPCCAILSVGLSSISTALKTVIGGGLNQILGVEKDMQQFEQAVVYPQNLINQARGLVGNLQGIFGQIRSLTQLNISSATLPVSRQLEQNLLSRDPNQIGQTSTAFVALYGTVPADTDASPQVRNIVDSSDAAAQAALKRAIEIDALADLELQAADQINQSIQTAAPGSAPIIEAQAGAWLIRANAYTQAATADLMRLHSVDLATSSANIKMGAANASTLRDQLIGILGNK